MTNVIDPERETYSVQPGVSDARLKELLEQAQAATVGYYETDQIGSGVRARRRDGRPPRLRQERPGRQGQQQLLWAAGEPRPC